MTIRITFVRHGETSWNAAGKWQGHAFVPLNDQGREQAARLADHFSTQSHSISAIYTSDLVRASETATIIATRLGKPVIEDARFREIDVGEWQGLTGEEIRAWDGERYHEVMSESMHIACPGGESRHQVGERMVNALEEIMAAQPRQDILVVTHGGTIANCLRYLNLEVPSKIGNTSYSRLLYTDNPAARWVLDAFNVLIHLEPSTQPILPSGEQGA